MIVVSETDFCQFSWHVFVNRPYRFVIFSIPKVASTEWIKLFRRMQGAEDWRADPHQHEGSIFSANLSDHVTNASTKVDDYLDHDQINSIEKGCSIDYELFSYIQAEQRPEYHMSHALESLAVQQRLLCVEAAPSR